MEKGLDDILEKYKSGRREDLIPLLQEIQESSGFLSEEAIVKVGSLLNLSTTKIYGLATFYDEFRFIPRGKVHIKICNGTSCFLNGSGSVIRKMKEILGIEPGQTTRDGNFSFEIVTCMGGCTNGPVLLINGDFQTHIKPEQLPDLVNRLKYMIDNNQRPW
jgi:NADH-quinone oxidoreductase E subunit